MTDLISYPAFMLEKNRIGKSTIISTHIPILPPWYLQVKRSSRTTSCTLARYIVHEINSATATKRSLGDFFTYCDSATKTNALDKPSSRKQWRSCDHEAKSILLTHHQRLVSPFEELPIKRVTQKIILSTCHKTTRGEGLSSVSFKLPVAERL